jgi:hypothetical protein
MKQNQVIGMLCLAFAAILVTACGAQAPTPDGSADRIATRVAEDLAVAATLTARAPQSTPVPVSPSPVPARPTETLAPTPPADTPTATARPLSPTPVPATPTKPAAQPPTATPTRFLVAVLPVDGSNGNQNLHNGQNVKGGKNVLLPGFAQSQVSNPMVFRDRIVFQVEVFDATKGQRDGDGIKNVRFVINGPNGQVHERTENTAGYCAFGGGEPDCVVWVFSEHGGKWPGGAQVVNGTYNVQITITPSYGEPVDWFWTFEIQRSR